MTPHRSLSLWMPMAGIVAAMLGQCPRAFARRPAPIYQSVEWVVADSDLIARGKPNGRWSTEEYCLRSEAYKVLRRWHAAGARPVFDAPDAWYRPVSEAWPLPAAVLAAALGLALLRRRLRRLRAGRALLRPASVLLMLGISIVLLWIRSYWRVDEVLVRRHGRDYQLASFEGGLQFSRVSGASIHPSGGAGVFFLSASLGTPLDVIWCHPFITQTVPPILNIDWDGCGLSRRAGIFPVQTRGGPSVPASFTFARLPLWPAAALTLLPGLWFLIRRAHRRRHREFRGYCLACGYNLSGNLSGVCPECGEPAPWARAPSAKTATTG